MDQAFIKRTLSRQGKEKGKIWLENIPKLIKEFEGKWSIKVTKPYELYINYVAEAVKPDGSEVVIKICFPEDNEFKNEAAALKLFNGKGSVKLLNQDLEKGILLLERLKPGTSLNNLEDDQEATRIITGIMKKLWKPIPKQHQFPSLTNWSLGFNWYYQHLKQTEKLIPKKIIQEAEKIFRSLLNNPHEQFLLHGDLHHGNILSSSKDWLAIDPKGVIGEREYEVAAMLRNPHKKLLLAKDPQKLLKKRIEILSKNLGFDKDRMIKWGFAQTILSVIWNLQAKGDWWKGWLKIAEILVVGQFEINHP